MADYPISTWRWQIEKEMAQKAAEEAATLEARASKSSEAEPGTAPKGKLRAADAAPLSDPSLVPFGSAPPRSPR